MKVSLLPRVLPALLLCFLIGGGRATSQNATPPKSQQIYDFGNVGLTEPVEHTFTFSNTTGKPQRIKNVQLLPPLVVSKMPAMVAPGATAQVTVRLGTPRQKGPFKSPVVVNLEDGTRISFFVTGKIVPPIEFSPIRAFFLSVTRGETKQASIDIINHEKEPLKILQAESSSPRFTTQLETLEPGRRYRLTVTLKGEGPAGKQKDEITLVTSSESHPFLTLPVFTYVKERVYVSPAEVDFGTISTRGLKARPDLTSLLTQQLMVYQTGGKDFQISATTDVPFLRLTTAGSPMKDRFQVTVTVVPQKLEAGKVNGTILILTNDPQFRQLTVPVKATVEGSW